MTTTTTTTLQLPAIRSEVRGMRLIPSTPLTGSELQILSDKWDSLVRSSYILTLPDLRSLLTAVQLPMQPVTEAMLTDAFAASKGRFSFQDCIGLLERCKTVHATWIFKMRGTSVDDDLVEAFVAVGGNSDCRGDVDISTMRHVVHEFKLGVDVDAIVETLGGDATSLDFNAFASLLRKQETPAPSQGGSPRWPGSPTGDDEDEEEDFRHAHVSPAHAHKATEPIRLSSQFFVNEREDLSLFGISGSPRRTPRLSARGAGGMGATSGDGGTGRRLPPIGSPHRTAGSPPPNAAAAAAALASALPQRALSSTPTGLKSVKRLSPQFVRKTVKGKKGLSRT